MMFVFFFYLVNEEPICQEKRLIKYLTTWKCKKGIEYTKVLDM